MGIAIIIFGLGHTMIGIYFLSMVIIVIGLAISFAGLVFSWVGYYLTDFNDYE